MLGKSRKCEIRLDFPAKQRNLGDFKRNLVFLLFISYLAYSAFFTSSQGKVFVHRSQLCRCNRDFVIYESPNASGIHWCSEQATLRGSHQRVVSYTVFADARDESIDERYHLLFKTIPQQIKQQYPDWRMRVYFRLWPNQKPVRRMICDMYCNNDNVDICDINHIAQSLRAKQERESVPVTSEELYKFDPLNWRYLAMLDPAVDVLMSRDADSEIISREVAAVNQWLDSDYTFHVMRDHPDHAVPIMAGMFGVKLDNERSKIESLTKAMIRTGTEFKKEMESDQYLLDLIFWPTVKDDAMIHDSYNCQSDWNSGKIHPFPTQRDNGSVVGDRFGSSTSRPHKCPVACRHPEHKDWEYC